MKKRISVLSVISLIVSILAFVLYMLVFTYSDAYLPWIISGIVAPVLPIFAKYVRNANGRGGKGFEIAALVIGSFDFYCVFFAATTWNIYIAFGIIAVECTIYAKCFNKKLELAQSNTGEGAAALNIETEQAVVDSAITMELKQEGKTETTKAVKQRYCKLCGGAIDPDTRKCTKCGKQYLRIGRLIKTALVILAVIAVLGLAPLSIYQHSRIADLEATVQQQEAEIAAKQTEVEEKQATIKSRNEKIEEMNKNSIAVKEKLRIMTKKAEFYDAHVVFVNNDGTKKYHKFGCDDFSRRSFWAYNTEAARGYGYSPCKKCCD